MHEGEKISHEKTPNLIMENNEKINALSHEKRAKYQQLYYTFKKSLGISADLKSKEEFDAAFFNLIGQLGMKGKNN